MGWHLQLYILVDCIGLMFWIAKRICLFCVCVRVCVCVRACVHHSYPSYTSLFAPMYCSLSGPRVLNQDVNQWTDRNQCLERRRAIQYRFPSCTHTQTHICNQALYIYGCLNVHADQDHGSSKCWRQPSSPPRTLICNPISLLGSNRRSWTHNGIFIS